MSDHAVEYLLGEILRVARALAAGHDELLSKEQVAVRLSVSVDRLDKWLRDGTLPKGRVWFQPPGLPVRISWAGLCEHYRATSGCDSQHGADDVHLRGVDDEPVPHWKDRA